MVDFEFIDVEGGDRFDLKRLDKIRCPDCSQADLVRTTQNDKFICPHCKLVIPESQLMEEVTLIPDREQGISLGNKPYFQQTRQNLKGPITSNYPAGFVIDNESNFDTVRRYSLGGIEQAELEARGNLKITKNGRPVKSSEVAEKTAEVIKKMFGKYVSGVEIDLS